MPMLNDKAERRRVAKLYERVRSLDAAIQAAEDDQADLARREAALRQRLEAEEARRPVETNEAEGAAADVLLRDPAAATTTLLDRITGAKRKRDASLSDWRASVAPIKAAIAKAEREQDRRRREAEDLRREHAAAQLALQREHHAAFMAEFERRAQLLVDEVLMPMWAIEEASVDLTAHLPIPRTAGHSILSFARLNVWREYRARSGAEHGQLNQLFPPMLCDETMQRRVAALERAQDELAAERG